MNFDIAILNPPYLGNLHLQILSLVQNFSKKNIVCLHPSRWIEDPLWNYKRNSDHELFKESIIDNISSMDIICGKVANRNFGMYNPTDLSITYIGKEKMDIELFNNLSKSIISKVLGYTLNNDNSMKDHIDEDRIDGVRCEVKEFLPVSNISNREDRTVRQKCIEFVNHYGRETVFVDGYDSNGRFWTDTKGSHGPVKMKSFGDPIPFSIKFSTVKEAENFRDLCRTNFFKNWIYLIKFDMHTPLFALPYIHDYTKAWSNADLCKFFNLTKEESDYMSAERYDYRVKDFIKYTN